MIYHKLKFSIWPVLHSEALVREPPTKSVLSDSDESEMEFTGQENNNYTSEFESHVPKPLSQHDLNVLIRDLDLTKQ